MDTLDANEEHQVAAILRRLGHPHPAHAAHEEGQPIADIAQCVEDEPELKQALLELNVAHQLRCGRPRRHQFNSQLAG